MRSLTVEEKREYLESYCLQQARISRYDILTLRNKDKKTSYQQSIENAKRIRDTIESHIENISDKRECEVLAQKYLCGRTLEETAELLNYSKRQVERIHIKALENLRLTTEDENGKDNFTLRP